MVLGMGHDVFLSYSTKDKTAAEAVCDALERKGVLVWIAPRDIDPASDYADSIIKAIEGSRAMVLTVSASANDSRDVLSEVKHASDKRIPIVPFRIENVMPSKSLGYFLGPSQYLDAFTPPMEPHYQALVKAVRQISSLPPGLAPPVPLPPPPSSKRFTRLLPILAGVAALLVASGIVASLYWEPPNPTPLESLPPPPKTSHLTPPQEVIGRTNPAVPASGNWAGFSETGTCA
jgi:TIR domain